MYTVDTNGNKKKIVTESFQDPIREPYTENYTSGKKKCPIWLYWVLGAVALLAIIMLIWWLTKKGRDHDGGTMNSGEVSQRFGFRFY